MDQATGTAPLKPEVLREVGLRFDTGKKGYELVPLEVIADVNEVYRFGAKKYAKHNWKLGMDYSKCYNAAQRHLNAYWSGVENDEESGLNHLLHAIWNLIALYWYHKNNVGTDDR